MCFTKQNIIVYSINIVLNNGLYKTHNRIFLSAANYKRTKKKHGRKNTYLRKNKTAENINQHKQGGGGGVSMKLLTFDMGKERTWEFCCEAVGLEGISEKNGLDFSWRKQIESHPRKPDTPNFSSLNKQECDAGDGLV